MAAKHHKPGSRSATKNICQERQIKVTRAVYEYKAKTDELHPFYHAQYVPWIQLKGKWLQAAGFEIDRPVKIRVMEGCLVLTTEEELDE